MTKKRSKKLLLTILRVIVVLGLFTVLGFQLKDDWGGFLDAFKKMSIWVFVLLVLLFGFNQGCCGLRWCLLLGIQKIKVSFYVCLKLFYLGLFYSNILPSSVGGDALRAAYVTKHTHKRLEAVLSVLLDRAIGLSCMAIMAFVSYLMLLGENIGPIIENSSENSIFDKIMEYKCWAIYVICGIFIVLVLFNLHSKGRNLCKKVFSEVIRRIGQLYHKFLEAVKMYLSRPGTVFLGILITLVSQALVIIGYYLLGNSMGIDVSVKYYFIFFPISWLIATIPISPGGLGVAEVGFAVLFEKIAGVPYELGLALAFCQRAVWYIISLPGGVIHITGAHLPGQEFFIDSKGSLD